MAQKTNLNISPYYDDFDSEKNFYKVLYKPGFPVQARELTGTQSILQNQIQSFGDHIFKEGSVVIPGNIAYDGQFSAVKLDIENYGIDISLYIKDFIGKKITGRLSGIEATLKYVALPGVDDVDDVTVYVTYTSADNNNELNSFTDGEQLVCSDSITYGNTTINAGTPFASLISSGATSIGSAAYIQKGVYFVRGYFVNVTDQTIILDYYSNAPSYRVGLRIDELIVSAKDDNSLYDNAKGFNNFSAPGADRFKINLTLSKKALDDQDDTDFVELLRVKKGKIKILNTKSNYNIVRDWIAERTHDESGDYTVNPFKISVLDSLNDNLGNGGLFYKDEKTDQLNLPSEDMMCVRVSDGKAYVQGYDIEKVGTTIIDVEKPRDVGINSTASVNFNMGSVIRINNVSGLPKQGELVQFYDGFGQTGSIIGSARAYNINLRNEEYSDASTVWDLSLFDVQTTTQITLNDVVSSTELPNSSFVKGKSSGASGYAVGAGSGSSRIDLNQTTGTFAKGEQIEVNGVDFSRTIGISTANTTQSIKSFKQTGITGFPPFTADSNLDVFQLPNGITDCVITTRSATDNTGISTITAGAKQFSGLRIGSTIIYQKYSSADPTYNKVKSIGAGNTSIVVSPIDPSVPGVFDGELPSNTTTTQSTIRMFVGAPILRGSGILHAPLGNRNVSTVDLSNSNLRVTKQLTDMTIGSQVGNQLLVNIADVTGQYTEITSDATFEPFDEERYSVHYSGGGIGAITEDTFKYELSGGRIRIDGLSDGNNNVLTASVKKKGIKSKIKNYNKSKMLDVVYSKYARSGSTAIGNGAKQLADGLTYDQNQRYGLRVQDERISLNYPDVAKFIAVYESIDNEKPTLDEFKFSSTANVQINAILGENIVGYNSKAIARVVNKSSTDVNTLGIVYLTNTRFTEGETVNFDESNIDTNIESITNGTYKDITNSFKLDKGQKDQYYDYSSIVRTRGSSEPSGRLLVIFDYYSISSDDDGDLFTALSYDSDRFQYDIPNIGQSGIRATDTIDLRPRVSVYDNSTNTLSPFAFDSRNFSIKQYLISNENADLGYEFYLPRIDKLYLNKFGEFVYQKGTSEMDPKPPVRTDDLMELATVNLPPYLYNTQSARLSLIDNRRFTMRDIGNIEDRVSNLEEVTTLSLLENNVQTLQIQDSEGRNRFKTGFFVDPFKNYSSISALSRVQINPLSQELIPIRSRNTLASQVTPKLSTTAETLDFNSDFDLFDGNVQKTGDVVTLKYDEEVWFGQYYATLLKDGSLGVINVNPYELPAILGNVDLQPDLDVWTRTIQLDDNVINQTGTNSSAELNLSGSGNIDLGNATTDTGSSEHVRTTDRSIKAGVESESDTSTLQGSTNLTASDSITISNTDISIQNRLISSASEDHMRSRNTEFKSTGFPANVKTYLFLDGQKIEDITPKLLAICSSVGGEYGATKAFKIGETVSVEDPTTSLEIMKFRVCTPNHKEGPYNNPTEAYSKDPYTNSPISNTSYTLTSPILNIDTRALAEEAQGEYHGYLVANAKLIGQETGAVAYVKDWNDNKMITDEYGDIIGTFYLRDPNSIPQPSVKVTTGRKNVRITTSSTNVNIAPGTRADIVIAEGIYSAQGTVEEWQNDRTIRVDTTTVTANADFSISAQGSVTSRHTTTRTVEYIDPIAQTFVVGGNVQAPSAIGANEDLNGLFLTAVEVFFASIDTEVNTPIRCEIRSTTGDARPSRTLMGRSRTLYPFTTDSNGNRIQNIQTDDTNASVGTKFTFPEPIFLPPGQSYAFVLVAERSVAYTVWLGEHGQKAVNSATIPGSTGESPTYARQYGAGALFKSQNGALWTEDQTQDLKFVLYRAKFTSSTGSVFFNNPNLSESNGYIPQLRNNPIRTLPKTGSITIPRYAYNASLANDNRLDLHIQPGRKLVAGPENKSTAVVDSVGDEATAVSVASTGTNYKPSQTNVVVGTYTITGRGSGLKLSVSTDVDGYVPVGNVSIDGSNAGSGYKPGDVVGIVTADMGGNKGRGAEITVTSGAPLSMDTIYLTDIQGQSSASGSWKPGGAFTLKYVKDDGTVYAPQASSADIAVDGFSADGGINDGKTFRVNQFDHGMYSSTNKVEISDLQTDTPSTALTADLLQNETGTISVASTLPFQYFEGIEVNGNTGNIGYIKIGNEIIGYQDANNTGIVIASSTNGRGIDNSIVVPHEIGDKVEKYELGGVSMRRISVKGGQTIANEDIGLDHYHVKIDASTNGQPGKDRSGDEDFDGVTYPELSFKNDSFVGGSNVKASKNIAYSAIVPRYDTMTPSGIDGSSTSITASIRNVSGSSVDGTEASFNDQGYRDVQLNAYNNFDNVSIVASKINENEYLTNLPRNKSFTTVLNFTSNNEHLSPMVYIGESSTEFISHRLNNPIGSDNYSTDNRVNTTIEDPHSAVYYSNAVRLSKPATSLKILLSAFRPENSDIRVLYRLDRLDSSEVSSEFELFPGYKNLIDNDEDGFGDIVIDAGKNDGRSDSFVGLSVSDQFREYQYTADNLDLFNGYTIKIVMSGTNQAKPPRIKELRSIAIR
tara:strand:- start:3479 stop:11128 length:7650 start_codon:yes stop_codon:yes gene_type:complete